MKQKIEEGKQEVDQQIINLDEQREEERKSMKERQLQAAQLIQKQEEERDRRRKELEEDTSIIKRVEESFKKQIVSIFLEANSMLIEGRR